jgi:hypothetical protein
VDCGTERGERGDRREVLTGGGGEGERLNSEGDGGSRPLRPAPMVQAEKENTKGIRWERPRNCRLNGKTERNRRDERDGVLTFGQG